MKLIENLKRKMEAIGGSVDEHLNFFCMDAPRGYVWNCNGLPTVTIHWANNCGQTWLAEAVRLEEPNLRMGLRLADEDELVEIRHNNDDDTWGAPAGASEKILWPKH